MTMEPQQLARLNTELSDFAAAGDLERVKAVVSLGAEAPHNFSVALRRAAAAGKDSVVEFLAGAGADIHAMSEAALRDAVKNGHARTVTLLLKRGADANALEGEPLIKAAGRGDEGMVRDLLVHKANPHFSDDQALRMASFGGHAGAVRLLLKFNADPFAMRASAVALAGKNDDVVQVLAEAMNEQRRAFLFTLALQDTSKGFLRASYTDTGESAFVRAVKMNCLDAVVEKMKQSGDKLSFDDLHGLKDRTGRSLAVLAAEYMQVKKLFDPAFWTGDVEGLKASWDKIPAATQKQSGITADDFQSLVAAHHQQNLKSGAGRFKLKP